MPSMIVRPGMQSSDETKSQPERQFNRWEMAVEIVKRMREAGISCTLSGPEAQH